jgi:hypothetical protein
MSRRSDEPMTRVSVFVFTRQLDALNALNTLTGIPVSVLIRQGVDRILAEHGITKKARRNDYGPPEGPAVSGVPVRRIEAARGGVQPPA